MGLESEHIERAALADLHTAATADIAQRLSTSVSELGSALVSVAGALPPSAIVMNRAVGFGLDGDTGHERLEQIVGAYTAAGVERFFLCVHPTVVDDALVHRLSSHNLEKARGWQKFSRGREPVPAIETDLATKLIGPEDGEALPSASPCLC